MLQNRSMHFFDTLDAKTIWTLCPETFDFFCLWGCDREICEEDMTRWERWVRPQVNKCYERTGDTGESGLLTGQITLRPPQGAVSNTGEDRRVHISNVWRCLVRFSNSLYIGEPDQVMPFFLLCTVSILELRDFHPNPIYFYLSVLWRHLLDPGG